MQKWWKRTKKGEWTCAIGLVSLLFAWLFSTTTVNPSSATIQAILAGKHAPLICAAITDDLFGFLFFVTALIFFLRGALKGEAEFKYIGFIGTGISLFFVIGHEIAFGHGALAYAKWLGWMS